jgi:outer membrane receptor protein involved in Fe transport
VYTTGIRLQQAAKRDQFYQTDYITYWTENFLLNKVEMLPGFPQQTDTGSAAFLAWSASINPFLRERYADSLNAWHQRAQAYANGVGSTLNDQRAYFEPGSQQFDSAFQSITGRSIADSGSRYIDRSALYHVQGEYRFTLGIADFTIGGNMRLYRPNSEGTIFSDTAGRRIQNNEFGIYGGVEKRVLDDKMKLNVSARLDKNQNFPYLFSPAASVVYEPAREQYLRASFSSAIRNPTLQDQYLYLFVGRALLAGNIGGYDDLVTVPSLGAAFDYNREFDSLSFFDVAPVRPERVRTLEAGYRATLLKRLYLDVSGYHSWYRDFIGYRIGADIDTNTVMTPFGGYENINVNNILRVATNATDQVTTMGATIGLNYYIGQYFAATVNYSWNRLDRQNSTDPLIPAFNTPEHKFNIGFNGRNWHNFSFNANYKWVQGYRFEGSPQFTGDIPSFGLVDVQVSRTFQKANTVVKVGASNMLNNLHYEVYGGPLVGRLVYASAIYSLAR